MALREVRIRNIAVFDVASWAVGDGFVALTGETGAGKSLCFEALKIVLGARPRSDIIRSGTERAQIVAVFDDPPAEVSPLLEEHGIPVEDDLLTLSREIPRAGKSLCRINGALAPIAVVRSVGELLIDITAQGASNRLANAIWQRQMVDAFSGMSATAALREYRDQRQLWIAAEERAHDVRQRLANMESDRADASDIVSHLGTLSLEEGEEERLETERERLRHHVELQSATEAIVAALAGDDTQTGSRDLLASANAHAARAAQIDVTLFSIQDRLGSLVDEVTDISRTIEGYLEDLGSDEGRLDAIEARLMVLQSVRRRYGSVAIALERLTAAQKLLDDGPLDPNTVQRVEREATEAAERVVEAAQHLHDIRAAAAERLAAVVAMHLRSLDLPHAQLVITVDLPENGTAVTVSALEHCTEDGCDTVCYRLCTNVGGTPLPLDEGPSGGELSRLALSLRTVVSSDHDAPTIALDEVDTGIGGATAAVVGRALSKLAASRQVIAITHRPEIAAYAAAHTVVTKSHGSDTTTSVISTVDGDARVHEIARLMSGKATDAALLRANELLGEAALKENSPDTPVASKVSVPPQHAVQGRARGASRQRAHP